MGFESPFWRKCGVKPGHPSYGAKKRSSSDLDWLYQKIAYASATAGGSSLDTHSWKHLFRDGQGAYNKIGSGGSSDDESFKDPIYIPKAHITSVTITGDPATYGAVRTCKVNFKTYNKGQLNALKGFLSPGKEFSATIGWQGRLSGTSTGFKGVVYKFNIQLTPDGGYECTSEAIGEGNTSITNIKVDATIPITTPKATDAAGKAMPDKNIFSEFQKMAEEAKNGSPGKATFLGKYDGCVAEIPEAQANSKTGGSEKNQSQQKKGYVTVKVIVDLLNEIIKTYCNPAPAGFAFPDPKTYMQTDVFSDIVSSDPVNVLINNNTYEGKTFAPSINKSVNGTVLEVENIYISLDWLVKQGNLITVDQDREKKSYLKINDFINKLFRLIEQSLGDAFSLTLARNAVQDDTHMYIIDINSIDKGITPTLIDSNGENNWVRNVNLTSNLTSEISTAFYVTAQAPVEAKAGSGGLLKKFLEGNEAKTKDEIPKWKDAVKAVGDDPNNDAYKSALASANKERVIHAKMGAPNTSVLVPFELSVTLEGTPGFKYGDAIRSSYVPDIYDMAANTKIGFMITQVEHTVSDGDWTTTLSTQCRLYK